MRRDAALLVGLYARSAAIKRVLEPGEESESPTSPIGEIETNSNATTTSRDLPYQGSPFKSGTCADCSGNSPDMCVNAVTNSPAHPPPTNAANTHQKETIGLPLRA
jgi:hypothetical protein